MATKSEQGARRHDALDERLFALLERTPRGHDLSLREIAREVGCSKANIWLIEQSALRKLKRAASRPEVRELLLSML
jgi:DNA-directed RNA polymerase sigma subunit (sigma70/sigma32)